MSSIPNKFDLHGDGANQSGYVPIQMIQNSEMVQSMVITSDQTNHRDMSSSPSFTFFQNSHASSSSSGFNNSAYHMMTRNISSVSGTDDFPINNNPHLTRVSFTQTITNRFTALVPTNTLGTTQYNIERVNRGMDSRSNFLNPTFHRPIFFYEQCEVLNPEPLNVIYPDQDFADRQHSDMANMSSNHNHDQHIPQHVPEPANIFEKTIDYIDLEEDEENEDDEYDGRTHSLPFEKYGPYTCPTCKGVFDTSQRFAGHMPSHYKNETKEEKNQRFHAKNKRKFQKLSHEDEVHGESSQKIRRGNGVNSSENVKEEPI